MAPQAGVEHTYVTLADLVDELAARFRAAGVRRADRVAVYKSDNVDIALLTCALSRIGAVPALLSPSLTPAVVGRLLARTVRPAPRLAGRSAPQVLTGPTMVHNGQMAT